mmetsp:Transcript_87252/g.154579  ORF Transcript_87252/g.154579 Transcript_87252/m.154579 type:complete len:245 (-) Transcript_87252:1864-2598(-)
MEVLVKASGIGEYPVVACMALRSKHHRRASRSMDAASGWKTTKLQLWRTRSGNSRSSDRTTTGSWPYLSWPRIVLTKVSTCSSFLPRSTMRAWYCSFASLILCQSSEVDLTKQRSISVAADINARMIDLRTSTLSVRMSTHLPFTARWKAFMIRCACGCTRTLVLVLLKSLVREAPGPLDRVKPPKMDADFLGSKAVERSSSSSSAPDFSLGSTGTDDDFANGTCGCASSRSGSVWKKMAPEGC